MSDVTVAREHLETFHAVAQMAANALEGQEIQRDLVEMERTIAVLLTDAEEEDS